MDQNSLVVFLMCRENQVKSSTPISCKAPLEQCRLFCCFAAIFDFFLPRFQHCSIFYDLFHHGSAVQAHSLSLAQSKVLIQHQRLLYNSEFLLTAKCYRALDVEMI